MRPVIGIVSRVIYPGGLHKLCINDEYRKAIIKNGGNPICILPSDEVDHGDTRYNDQSDLTDLEKQMLIEQISFCNGILMPGGFKINKYDRFICDYAIENDIPLLGICLGMQIMGSYKKDNIENIKNDSFVTHMDTSNSLVHSVKVNENSRLFSIVKKSNFLVNSRHNYHIGSNNYLDSVAYSEDGYVEAIEINNKKFCIGVQWHPENMNDDTSKLLFEEFINQSATFLR